MSTWNQQSERTTTHAAASEESPTYGARPQDGGGRGRAAETVVQATGREPRDLASDLGHTIRRNAIPLALIGAGAAWLTASQSRGRHAHDDLEGVGSSARNAGQRAAAYARDAGSTARVKAAEGVERARAASPDGGAAAERAGAVRDTAQSAMESLRDTYSRNPLLVGLLAAGGAAALATAVAARRSDGRLMQQARERAGAAGQHAAERAREEAGKVRTVAERTARAARETARETAAEEANREGIAGAEHLAGSRQGSSSRSSGSGSGTGRSE